MQPVMLDRISERSRNYLLARDLVKSLGPPFSCNNLVTHWSLREIVNGSAGKWKVDRGNGQWPLAGCLHVDFNRTREGVKETFGNLVSLGTQVISQY